MQSISYMISFSNQRVHKLIPLLSPFFINRFLLYGGPIKCLTKPKDWTRKTSFSLLKYWCTWHWREGKK